MHADKLRFTAMDKRPLNERLADPRRRFWSAQYVRCAFGRFEVSWCQGMVSVCKLGGPGWGRLWTRQAYVPLRVTVPYWEDRAMVMKWIKQCVQKAKEGSAGDMRSEPMLHKDRPALQEFMVAVGTKRDGLREPSVLMCQCTDDGIRVGIKDDDCGGWCWRWGESFEAALDAIEKALQGGEGAFRGSRPARGKGRK